MVEPKRVGIKFERTRATFVYRFLSGVPGLLVEGGKEELIVLCPPTSFSKLQSSLSGDAVVRALPA